MDFKKKIPESIGIFGASGHVGNPMARWLRYNASGIKLRLITSSEVSAAMLQKEFPDSEVAIGNYFDSASLEAAVAGLEGLYVVTPSGTDETVAMTNVVNAVKASAGGMIHIVRSLSCYAAPILPKVPEMFNKLGFGLEVQHPIAARILAESGLPVTFLNLGASFMDNFIKPPMLTPARSLGPTGAFHSLIRATSARRWRVC